MFSYENELLQLSSLAMGGRYRSLVYASDLQLQQVVWYRFVKTTNRLLSTDDYECESDEG